MQQANKVLRLLTKMKILKTYWLSQMFRWRFIFIYIFRFHIQVYYKFKDLSGLIFNALSKSLVAGWGSLSFRSK